ncbi:hypothetical protein DMENIID0001_100690 [Sergentomyia squamirostris]
MLEMSKEWEGGNYADVLRRRECDGTHRVGVEGKKRSSSKISPSGKFNIWQYLENVMTGKKVFGAGIGMTALLTLLTPLVAKSSIYLMVAIRVIEGIFEGVTYPCIHAIWARWAPVYERSRMSSIAYAGSYAGTVVSMPLSGVLAQQVSWESVFYVSGSIGCLWCISWLIIIKASPERDPYISPEEKAYIQNSIGDLTNQKIKHPWKSILTSSGVWAIVV